MNWCSYIAACLSVVPPMPQGSAAELVPAAAMTLGPEQGRPGSPAPFLSQSREVPPRLEWNREVTSTTGGTIQFRVTSRGPFAVTVVTGEGYDALRRGDRTALSKRDVLLTVDSPDTSYEGRVTLPQGSSWFIIQNQTQVQAAMTLQCYTVQ